MDWNWVYFRTKNSSGPKFKTHLGQVRISYFHWNFVFFFNFFANLKSVKWNCHSSNQFWSLQHRVRNAWLQRYNVFFWQISNGTSCSVSALFRGYKIIFGNKQNAESSWFISQNFIMQKFKKIPSFCKSKYFLLAPGESWTWDL